MLSKINAQNATSVQDTKYKEVDTMATGYKSAQVVIAGGGVAGIAAGIASARNGVETLVVERYGFLGGMFTGGNMTVLNSHPSSGIGREIVDTLMEQGFAKYCPDDPPNYPIFHYNSEYCALNVVYDAEMAKILLFKMAEEAGVKLLLHSFMAGAVTENGKVKGIIAVNKSGHQIIEGDIVIDATADGDVAASAGAAFRKGQTESGILFAMTMLVRLSNVIWSKVSEYSKADYGLDRAIAKAIGNGELPYYKPRSLNMINYWGHPRPELSHMVYDDEAIMWGGTVEGVDGTNVDDLTRAEVEVRKQLMSELNFLKKYIPGFENAKIENSGIAIGVRDTRHIIGEYTLTGEDILERKSFPDVVSYNIKGGFPATEIPYGCLVPKGLDGLLVSGNCISVVPGSTYLGLQLGSYNNLKDIPTMWTTGDAAGTAAALCVKNNVSPRKLDVQLLQQQLFKQGALLTADKIKELENVKLPSGKTVLEFHEDSLSKMKEYWKGKKDYSLKLY
jgi:hypothetical protein